jgi:hypothetical protein
VKSGVTANAGRTVDAGRTAKATRTGARMLAVRDGLGACEQRLEREPRTDPRLAIAGASYTAGVGPGVPSRSWAAVLARTLRWDCVIYGVPGPATSRRVLPAWGPSAACSTPGGSAAWIPRW